MLLYSYCATIVPLLYLVIMDKKTHKTLPKLILYDENSEIHRVLNIAILLNTYIKIEEKVISIIAKDVATATYLKEHLRHDLSRIKEYFEQDTIRITVEDIEADQKTPVAGEPAKAVKPGKLNGYIKKDYVEYQYIIGEPNKLVYNTAMNFIEQDLLDNNIIYVYGAPGTGKSHLFHLLADTAVKAGKSVYLNSAVNFTEHAKNEYLSKEFGKKHFLKCFHSFVMKSIF